MRYLKSCILHDVNISRERKVYIESIPYRKQARSLIFITILLSDLNVKFANNVIMFLIWRFVKFSNVSDIFLAFKYVWNILTAPFVAQRVFLHLFLSRFFWIQPRPLWQTVQADAGEIRRHFVVHFIFCCLKEPRMKDAPWLANVAERRKIWLDRGILESIFLFLAQIGVTLPSTPSRTPRAFPQV